MFELAAVSRLDAVHRPWVNTKQVAFREKVAPHDTAGLAKHGVQRAADTNPPGFVDLLLPRYMFLAD